MSIGVAVLGMGRWGTTWQRVLGGTPGVRVVATSRSAEHPDFADAVAAAGVEAVVVALPLDLHLAAIRCAVELGKHVLCEKPAVPTRLELDALRALPASSVEIRVCQNYRARVWAAQARAAVAEIGTLSQVSVDFAQSEFLDGGRSLLRHPLLADLAIHHLDLLRWLTGQEAQVLAARTARPAWSRYRGDSDAVGLLQLEGGATVTYTAGWSARAGSTPWDGNWRFRGERGVVEVVDRRVTLDQGEGPVELTGEADPEDSDLERVWHDFRTVMEGRDPASGSMAVSVAEHARSLGLVLDMAEVAGVIEPHRAVVDK